jgi:cytochrome c
LYYKLALIFLAVLIYGGAHGENLKSISSGAKIFKKCQGSHQMGPQLYDIFGQSSGGLPGVKYSKSMIWTGEEGLVWNSET